MEWWARYVWLLLNMRGSGRCSLVMMLENRSAWWCSLVESLVLSSRFGGLVLMLDLSLLDLLCLLHLLHLL